MRRRLGIAQYELIPIYGKFIELSSTDLQQTIPGEYVVDINKLCDKFSEFVRFLEKGEKIKKLKTADNPEISRVV